MPKSDIKPFDHVSKSESIGPDFGYSENPLPLWVDLDVKENKVKISKKKHLKPIEDPPYIDDYGDYDNYDDMDYDMSQVTADKEFKCQVGSLKHLRSTFYCLPLLAEAVDKRAM